MLFKQKLTFTRECVCGMLLRATFVFVDVSMLFTQELTFTRECVCGMSLRATFVFVDVFMLFKQRLIFFTRFTFFYEGDINDNILE
jgi:hypothetical protein